ncbi:MAG: hypothetical protein U5O15_04740 [Candidatus Krumholzibacteriota bacterium]|nr:hypothetical protein [Candidatus Krumholzibacteriota bacterium]
MKKIYLGFLIPALAGFISVYLLKRYGILFPEKFSPSKILSTGILVISSISALAGPVFLRANFANSVKGKKSTRNDKFMAFEKKLIRLALITPYFCIAAYIFDLTSFYMTAIFLLTLYSLYYFYPSERRINFERRIFRVK